MVSINKQGYLQRRTGKRATRDWWLIKHSYGNNNYNDSRITIKCLHIPNKYIGKRVRFKIQIEPIYDK